MLRECPNHVFLRSPCNGKGFSSTRAKSAKLSSGALASSGGFCSVGKGMLVQHIPISRCALLLVLCPQCSFCSHLHSYFCLLFRLCLKHHPLQEISLIALSDIALLILFMLFFP